MSLCCTIGKLRSPCPIKRSCHLHLSRTCQLIVTANPKRISGPQSPEILRDISSRLRRPSLDFAPAEECRIHAPRERIRTMVPLSKADSATAAGDHYHGSWPGHHSSHPHGESTCPAAVAKSVSLAETTRGGGGLSKLQHGQLHQLERHPHNEASGPQKTVGAAGQVPPGFSRIRCRHSSLQARAHLQEGPLRSTHLGTIESGTHRNRCMTAGNNSRSANLQSVAGHDYSGHGMSAVNSVAHNILRINPPGETALSAWPVHSARSPQPRDGKRSSLPRIAGLMTIAFACDFQPCRTLQKSIRI